MLRWRRELRVESLRVALAHGGYALAVGLGLAAVAGLTIWTADIAPRVIGKAVVQSNAAEVSMPRVMKGAPTVWSRAAEVKVDTSAIVHARTAPAFVGQIDPMAIDDLKRALSERIVSDDASPWHQGDRTTYRTMCVRLCDGAYFPISYATTRDRFARDEAECASRCGVATRLFTFANPGGSPDIMQDREGRSYIALPTAFQFRREVVAGCSCKAQPWEEASRERHRLFALEQDVAAGRAVEVAELDALRAKYAAPAGAAEGQDNASSKSTSVLPVAIEEPSPLGADKPALGNGDRASYDTLAALPVAHEHFAVLSDQSRSAVPTSPPMSIAPIAALEPRVEHATVPPLPVRSNLEPVAESAKPQATATLEKRSVRVRKGKKRILVQRGGVVAVRAPDEASVGLEASAEVAPPVKLKPTVIVFDSPVVERPVWGVGRNARGVPRGGSAYETFARNFY